MYGYQAYNRFAHCGVFFLYNLTKRNQNVFKKVSTLVLRVLKSDLIIFVAKLRKPAGTISYRSFQCNLSFINVSFTAVGSIQGTDVPLHRQIKGIPKA